jgi:hypothetical protein
LKGDGSVVAWGYNGDGQTTVPAAAQNGVTAVAAGLFHTVALKSDGSVIAWGDNQYGQSAVPLGAKSGVVAVAAGVSHTVALRSDGSLVQWRAKLPVPVGFQPVLAIAAGFANTVALVADPPPSLNILRRADQRVTLSWSGIGALEQTESLSLPNWQPATSQANPQSVSTAGAMKVYRVKAD